MINIAAQATPQRRAISGLAGAHKSAEDLTLSNQFHNQCRTTGCIPHQNLKPQVCDNINLNYSGFWLSLFLFVFQRQWSANEASPVPQVAHTSPQHLDSISFYNRPSHPMSSSSSSLRAPELHLRNPRPYHQQPYHHQQPNNLHDYHYNHYHLPSQPSSHSQTHQARHRHALSSHKNDEGGFEETRCFRTLPASKKTELNL